MTCYLLLLLLLLLPSCSLGAHGVMVPLVNSRADAEMAVSHCLFPPQGQRSVAYPVR
jgi:2-keto-3-deoxy-L-rhamnonate aldolase RhmA